MKLHHLGIAVKDIQTSSDHYLLSLGWKKKTDIVYDPVQKVNVLFMADENDVMYELLEAADENAPITSFLKRRISLYHFCYEVEKIESTITHLTANGFFLISGPDPATAFQGKKVAFLINKDNLIIELVEK